MQESEHDYGKKRKNFHRAEGNVKFEKHVREKRSLNFLEISIKILVNIGVYGQPGYLKVNSNLLTLYALHPAKQLVEY